MADDKRRGATAAHCWWLDGHNSNDTTPRRSPWLQSTLSALDERMKAMVRIIEEDADSFAQRAEMYYKKRPELIGMVEDLYRAHRSLAERFDQVKSNTGVRLITPWESPLSIKYRQQKPMTYTDKSYDSYSETYDTMESVESEVEDPDQEEEEEDHIDREMEGKEITSSKIVNCEVVKLREEMERLKEENKIQKEQLVEKDEEKREVIRQLSVAMDLLREENVKLRKCIAQESTPKKWTPPEFHKLKGMFLRKLFNESPKSVVALQMLGEMPSSSH